MSSARAKAEARFHASRVRARQLLAEKSRSSLIGFTRYTKRDFLLNWHHLITATALERFADRLIENLIVLMPPRIGKTELVSRRFPAWVMGRNPDTRIIAASYSAELASRNNRDVQRIIDSDAYRDIFPETTIAGPNATPDVEGAWTRNNDLFEVVGRRGTYRSAGVGGSITGMGGDIILLDDPIKNAAEAESKTKRDSIYEWYQSTLFSRREGGAGIVLVMTRWHEDDLAGRILANAKKEGERWTVVSFPMIHEGDAELPYDVDPVYRSMDPREEGEPIWYEKYDLAECTKIEKAVGTKVWTSLYQQRPAAAEGNIIKRHWLKRTWTVLPTRMDEQLISVDCAFKDTSDSAYVAIGVWGRVGADRYLMDQFREKVGFVDTVKAIRDMSYKWPNAFVKLIEGKANGPAVIDTLKSEVPGLIEFEPEGSKEARLWAVSPDFEANNVILPDSSVAPWVHDYKQELLSFPNSAYADQVDQTSQALLRFRKSSTSLLDALTKH